MTKSHIRQFLIVALTVLMLYTNLLSGSGGGFSEDSGVYFQYPTSFSPAPFTFAIWFPIFLGTLALAIFQALPKQANSPMLDRLAISYALALVANALTPFVSLGISNLVVLVLFLALAVSFATTFSEKIDPKTKLFVRLPLATFSTWAAIATVLNACQWVVAQGGSVTPSTAAGLVSVVMVLGVLAILRTREAAIAAVMVWAGIGIAAANPEAPLLIATIAITSVATVAVALNLRSRQMPIG